MTPASLTARIEALEHALTAALRGSEDVSAIAAMMQDPTLDEVACGAQASPGFRAGFRQERLRLAAMLGGPIVGRGPDTVM